jgi:hypothetical protein
MPPSMRGRSVPARVLGVTFLLVLSVGYLYELWYHPFVVGIATVVVVALGVRNRRRMKRHLTALAQARQGESICEFSRAFDMRNTDTWVIRAVYEQLQHQLRRVYPSFPVRATDRLIEDLMLDPDDIDMDIAVDVIQRTGRSWRNGKTNPYFGRVQTAHDLVQFWCAQKKA